MNEIEREKENIEVSHKFILEVVSFSGNVHFSEREVLGEENPLFRARIVRERILFGTSVYIGAAREFKRHN